MEWRNARDVSNSLLTTAAIEKQTFEVRTSLVRDVLTARTPSVLKAEIYAVAALAGAAVVTAGEFAGPPATTTALPGIGLCLFLRMMAIYRGWTLPSPRQGKNGPRT
jgi:uncharacterized membrane protein YeiH